MPLSEKQMTYLALAWQCFDNEPKIDYARLATLASLASAASARELVRQAKKKLKDEHGVADTNHAEKSHAENAAANAAEVERVSIVVGLDSPQTPRGGGGGGGIKRKGRGGGAAGGSGAKGTVRKHARDDEMAAPAITASNSEGEAETPNGRKTMLMPKKRGMGKKMPGGGGRGGRKRKNQGDGQEVATAKKVKAEQGDRDEDETMGDWLEGVETELTDGEMAF